MKKRKTAVGIIIALVIIWSSMFIIDLVRCNNLREPIFHYSSVTADDGGSGIYKCPFYTVEIEKHIDARYGVKTDYIEMRLFGKLVSAVIVD